MSSRSKRKHRQPSWDKLDADVLEATPESFRIHVDRTLHQFLSDDTCNEYSFAPNLTNLERKYIHQKAAMNNLVSRSRGQDPDRVITIYKRARRSNFESFDMTLSHESMKMLEGVVFSYVPQPYEKDRFWRRPQDKVFGKMCFGSPKLVMPYGDVDDEIVRFRSGLPTFDVRLDIVRAVRNNQVLLISAETGSGKTTQVPQYIMDDARMRGETCRIICTQPRRISAVSVANRVAKERGLDIGTGVGYHIRLESFVSTDSNLIYCTNGVLIRTLMSGQDALGTITHVIIDEVHERDKLSDFLLVCLRESLRRGAKIKLILMSATLNLQKFSDYFGNAEVMTIPGRLFDIDEFFLGDVLQMTGYNVVDHLVDNFIKRHALYDEAIDHYIVTKNSELNESAWAQLFHYLFTRQMGPNYQHTRSGFTPLMAAVFNENVAGVEQIIGLGGDPTVVARSGCTAFTLAEERQLEVILMMLNNPRPLDTETQETLLDQYYKSFSDEDIDFDLLTELIVLIVTKYKPGAILVFLPGYDDIMICHDRIKETVMDPSLYRVFFLHGSMSTKEQNEVFKNQGHVRKIILSTNIAETSITIDDVSYVIDCGKAKMQQYDSCSGLSSLQTQWISKACVKQRAGRAGRTRDGSCFHLFSKARYESLLEDRIPEILRVPLEELCLNTKSLAGNFTPIYDFLVMAPDPPSSNTVKTAIENLQSLGALDNFENLTPLGEYLSQITIEPHLGKMLIYSAIFKCLDPVLTIVACLTQKDPFVLPPQANLRTLAAERRKDLMLKTFSDHMAYLEAFQRWQYETIHNNQQKFSRDYFISLSTMETILKIRQQLMGQLRATRFIPNHGVHQYNRRGDNWPLVKAILASGLYPRVAFKKNEYYCTRTENKVIIHNSNPLNKETMNVWLLYDEMLKMRNNHFLRGVTPVTPVTIALMCGTKTSCTTNNSLEIDDWLELDFGIPHVFHLRKHIDSIIQKKLQTPYINLKEGDEVVIDTLALVLKNEERGLKIHVTPKIGGRPYFSKVEHFNGACGTPVGWRRPLQPQGPEPARPLPEPRRPLPGPRGQLPEPRGQLSELARQQVPEPSLENTIFLLITVRETKSVNIAFKNNRWVFAAQTEKHVVAYNNQGVNVFLVYMVQETRCYHGIAKFVSLDTRLARPVGTIQWIFTNTIPFNETRNLRTGMDNNRLLHLGSDGQVIEASLALTLWGLFNSA